MTDSVHCRVKMKRNYPSGAEKRRKQNVFKKLPKLTNFSVTPATVNDNNTTTHATTTISTAASEEELPVAADSASPGCSSDIAANVTSKATLQDEEDPSTSGNKTSVFTFSDSDNNDDDVYDEKDDNTLPHTGTHSHTQTLTQTHSLTHRHTHTHTQTDTHTHTQRSAQDFLHLLLTH